MEIDKSEVGWYDLESKQVEILTSHGMPYKFPDTGFFVGTLILLEDKLHPRRGSLLMKIKRGKLNLGDIPYSLLAMLGKDAYCKCISTLVNRI